MSHCISCIYSFILIVLKHSLKQIYGFVAYHVLVFGVDETFEWNFFKILAFH